MAVAIVSVLPLLMARLAVERAELRQVFLRLCPEGIRFHQARAEGQQVWKVAASVDLAITAMVFWVLSGLWMWWEMKATRGFGALYQQHISAKVKKSDLFSNGRDVSRNRWNNSTTAGAMHLIQPNNTLGAEIELAALTKQCLGRRIGAVKELEEPVCK